MDEVAKALSAEVSATCGYQARVEAKPLDHKRPHVACDPSRLAGQADRSRPGRLERSLQASFDEVWQERTSLSSVSREIIILGDHGMPNDTLLACASRTCTFQIRARAWSTGSVGKPLHAQDAAHGSERGQVWVRTA